MFGLNMKPHSGFTIKELIMVIVIIGILCIAAIPPYYSLQSAKRRTEFEKTITLVSSALQKLSEDKHDLPQTLDTNPAQSPCLDCFSSVLPKGTNSPLWYKFDDKTYLYSTNGNHDKVTDYQESGDFKLMFETGQLKYEEIR